MDRVTLVCLVLTPPAAQEPQSKGACARMEMGGDWFWVLGIRIQFCPYC